MRHHPFQPRGYPSAIEARPCPSRVPRTRTV